MDVGRAFTYPFEDEDWLQKMLIGAVLNLVPVVNFIPMGYGLRQMKKVSEGQDLPLPEWDDWGGDFVKGLLMFLATIIYTLPIWLCQLIVVIVVAIAGNSDAGNSVAALCSTAMSCLMAIYGIAMAVWLPAAVMQYVKEDTFGAFFRFAEIWAFITGNLGDYFVAWLVYLLAGIVASIVGGIACGIGVLFTTFWASLVMAKLFGDLIEPSDTTSAEPIQPISGDAF